MRYLKTFESFSPIDETLDMFTLPVDPMRGAAEMYSDIADAVGGKLTEVKEKMEKAAQEFADKFADRAEEIIKSAEKFFGAPASSITYDMVVSKLKKMNESFIDKYDEADPYDGHGETMTTPIKDVKGGIFQKVCSFFQRIFAINLLTCGALGTLVSWLIGLASGTGDIVNFAWSFVCAIIGIIVVNILRKLDTMFANR